MKRGVQIENLDGEEKDNKSELFSSNRFQSIEMNGDLEVDCQKDQDLYRQFELASENTKFCPNCMHLSLSFLNQLKS
jgi:hypothetical protein